MNIDFSKIKIIEIEDIHSFDYPDFCDAFIASADYHDKPMSDDKIDYINDKENRYINEIILDNQIY